MKNLLFILLFIPSLSMAEGKLERNNIFSIMFGYGADGKVDVENVGGVANAKASRGPLPGVQYQRIFLNEIVVGGSVLLNGTVMFSTGLKF